MIDERFVTHLAYLNKLEELELGILYANLSANNTWPHFNDEGVCPLALIVFAVTALVQRLNPEASATEHPEMSVLAQSIGALLYQLSSIETLGRVGVTPITEAGSTVAGMRQVCTDILRMLKMDYSIGAGLFFVATEDEDGATDTAEQKH